MRAIKGRDTKPELKVRRVLRGFAPGYRLHRKDIPGRPDIAYVGRKIAIFVHGCFWHGHDCARGVRQPKANAEFWRAKIARNRNRERDAEALARLQASGWRAEVIWECEMGDEHKLEARLRALVA
jgi:DNA mismatch endonuclease (patch repair protein)